jgi:hypothetical protein
MCCSEWWDHMAIKVEYVFVKLDDTPFCQQYLGLPLANRQHQMVSVRAARKEVP